MNILQIIEIPSDDSGFMICKLLLKHLKIEIHVEDIIVYDNKKESMRFSFNHRVGDSFFMLERYEDGLSIHTSSYRGRHIKYEIDLTENDYTVLHEFLLEHTDII